MVRRVYTEKKDGFNTEAVKLREELIRFLGGKYPELAGLKSLRILRRYDMELPCDEQLDLIIKKVLSEPAADRVFYGGGVSQEPPVKGNERFFGIENAPGQYSQKADWAEQCAELVIGTRPRIKTADIYVFEGDKKPLSDETLKRLKKFLINPAVSREASMELPSSFDDNSTEPRDVAVLKDFILMDEASLEKLAAEFGIAMPKDDLLFCRDWFKKEGRDPTITEIKVLDTYWSDHCRHSTFNTELEEITIAGKDPDTKQLKKALELYKESRREIYGEAAAKRKHSLMDMATIGAKALRKRGLIQDLDESTEVNACSIKVKANFSGAESENWLLFFKNETHNHPTEIEPFGGAATCLGGAIRDPLSGRACVYQALRLTGGADPRTAFEDTLNGKLPQIKIAHEAAAGYSSYGNQIGLSAGQVSEVYHPGFEAKRMELGAVIGAAPEAWVRREEPVAGDVVILTGGKTGRDGIGGATGSSGSRPDEKTGPAAEVKAGQCPAGNALEERKIVRLFRKPEVLRLIKRCNDFGAGGVSVAVGELADGLEIDLDAVPKKYNDLDGTEIAISESQERMAVLTSASDAELFIKAAAEEDLDAVIIARVTGKENARLRMSWRGKTIVDLSREFLNTNGAPRKAKALLKAAPDIENNRVNEPTALPAGVLLDNLERELAGLRSGSRRGLTEQFGSSVGAGTVLFPWGGKEQGTPECGMAALLPSMDKQSRTASVMSFGYDPAVMSIDPYTGAKGSVREALAKFACLGADPFKARLSLQEYFERTADPETWGKPAAALLGALEAQLRLGVPAIGGKDSMSGNYSDGELKLAVPPTLVAFAAGTCGAENIHSGALSGKEGNALLLLSQSPQANGAGEAAFDEWEKFKANMKILKNMAASGALRAAYPVGPGGIAATIAVMAFGNMTGVEVYAETFSYFDPANYQGSVLAEIDTNAVSSLSFSSGPNDRPILAGRTLNKPVFRIVNMKAFDDEVPESYAAETPLEVLRRAYEYALKEVYPQTSTGATVAEPADGLAEAAAEQAGPGEVATAPPAASPAEAADPADPAALGEAAAGPATGKAETAPARKHTCLETCGAPLVVLPVFPGTNCERDTERAFRRAGAKTRFVIWRGRDIAASIKEMEAAFKEAQIIALPGGSSASGEPDGAAKFIVNALRLPAISAAITEFLEKRDGLILGIGDGFQALVKTGLLPGGRFGEPNDKMPNFARNAIGLHVSRMVRTRVMPNNSPWLSLEEEGCIHVIPFDNGEGRIMIGAEEAEGLFAAAQVPFCYADAAGNPAVNEPDNPGGSAFAIEALTSPDGRILGKMGHSERCGEFVHINIPGNKRQRIFEAAIGYFQNL